MRSFRWQTIIVPGQVVISGHKPALERAMAGAKAAGAKRAMPLPVSIAAHSPLMDSIQSEWNAAVDACAMSDRAIPVVGNVHAKAMLTADELRADIKAQMQSRVRWTESVQMMLANGIQTYVEVGSGEVLLGLIKRIDPSANQISVGQSKRFRRIGTNKSAILSVWLTLSSRVQRVIEEMLGNEALLEMLETDAAAEMLNWGTAMATSLVKTTEDWMICRRIGDIAALESGTAIHAFGGQLGSGKIYRP